MILSGAELFKWQRRERKYTKRRHGMRVDGASVKVLERIIKEKGKK